MKLSLARIAAGAALLACAGAQADDLDVAVVGPTGHSSVTAYDQFIDFHGDLVSPRTGRQVGQVHSTDNTVVLGGTWAVNDRLSLTARLPWTVANRTTVSTPFGASADEQTGAGGQLDATGWVIGSALSPGFRMAASVGAQKHAGQDTSSYAALQPQWRFREDLLLTSRLGVAHSSSDGTSQFANAYLVWRAAPQFSLTPSLGYTHWPASQGFASYDDTRFGLTFDWHFGHGWTAALEADHVERSDRRSETSGVNQVNGRYDAWFAGVRRSF